MKIFLITFYFFLITPAFAQVVFNKVYKVGGDNYTELLPTDTGYISVAVNNTSVLQGINVVDFSTFDLQGNFLDTVKHVFPETKNFPENCGKCLQSNNKSLYYSHSSIEASDSAYIKIIKFSKSFDTIKTINYSFKDSFAVHVFALEFDTDSTFIITGLVYRPVPNKFGKWDVLISKVDTSLNILWEKRIHDNRGDQIPTGYVGKDILVDSYGTVLVSGYGRYGPNIGFCTRIKPETGEVIWFKEFTDSMGAPDFMTVDNEDGTYQYLQWYITSIDPNTQTSIFNRFAVGRMDTMGNILTKTVIGPKNKFLVTTDLIKTSDGNFYTAGIIIQGIYYNSFGLKFAPNGDSLWMRYYHHEDKQDHSQLERFFETPDSGFIHAGFYADLYQGSPGILTWLLKTDKYGCDSIGCETVGLSESTNHYNIDIYPNPSNGEFIIKWPHDLKGKQITLQVFSVMGKEVFSKKVVVEYPESSFDLSSLSKGIYTVKLYHKGNSYFPGRLLLN